MDKKYYYPNSAGWGCTEDETGFSFYNKITGEDIPKVFIEAYTPNDFGWAVVKDHDGWTFFNVNTWQLCEERFLSATTPDESNFSDVKQKDFKNVFFNPETRQYRQPNYLANKPVESE